MDSIVVKNVSFKYGKNRVLDNVSFKVEQGKYTAILGQNGSGKSTIAKLIMSLLELQDGEIFIENNKLEYNNVYELRNKIGIVFQNPDNQFIGATVRDDIAFGLENKCIDPNEMDELIHHYSSIVKMEDKLDFEPSKLSGGQKQRVAIAGILAMKPSILILDEATSMLDPSGKKEMNELVFELCKKYNMTVISITHDIEEAANAHSVVVLDKGVVIKQDTPQMIFNCMNMSDLKLDVPFGYAMADLLKSVDIDIEKTHQIESMVDELWQLNLKK